MIAPSEYFRSVELVWLIWIISSGLLAWMLKKVLSRIRAGELRSLLKGEDGAAYMISYVMAFPIFMALVSAVVQSGVILIVKMGTVYAAYSSARSAIVWIDNDPRALAFERVQQSAVNSMAPFSSSSALHAEWLGVNVSPSSAARKYFEAYQSYSSGSATLTYIGRKYDLASKATTVTWSPFQPKENEPVELTLRYRMPLHFPWFTRLLGLDDGILPITTKVTLPFEGARNAENQRSLTGYPMGIPYNSY
jgi:hypothetical protein